MNFDDLEQWELECLWWRIHEGKSPTEIQAITGFPQSTFFDWQKKALNKLGCKDIKELESVYGPALKAMTYEEMKSHRLQKKGEKTPETTPTETPLTPTPVSSETPTETPKETPPPEKTPSTPQELPSPEPESLPTPLEKSPPPAEEIPPPEEPPSTPPPEKPPQPPEIPRRDWRNIFNWNNIKHALIYIGLAVGFYFVMRDFVIRDGNHSATPFTPIAVVETSTETPTEILVPMESEQVSSAVEPSPTNNFTPEPPTNTPTVTLAPSSTPTPKPTRTPNPTPVILLYDDFSQKNPEWEIKKGQPFWSNRKLISEGESWVTRGDPGWTNYKVTINAYTKNTACGREREPNIFAVRMNGLENMVALKMDACHCEVFIVNDGNWIPVSDTTFDIGHDISAIYVITAYEDKYTVHANGQEYALFFDGSLTQGYIGIGLWGNSYVEDILVEELP